jgi:hypothetical protein
MKVTVGLVGHGTMSQVRSADDPKVLEDKFIADTCTIYLDRGKDTENMHEGNYVAVALAVARKRLQTEVFPVSIEKPDWLPKRPVKRGENVQ